MMLVVVILKTIVAIDVAAPLRKEIAKNRPEPAGMEERVEVGNGPASNSPYPVQGFVVSRLHHNLP